MLRKPVVLWMFALTACSADSAPGFGPADGDVAEDGGGGVDALDDATSDVGYDTSTDVAPIDAGDDAADDAATPDTGGGDDINVGPICGNGRTEVGEACDDGNNFPGDGCNASCTSDERCGNAIIDLGEACDDGNVRAGDGCDHRCQTERGCGNGVLEVGEQCDDGNVLDADGCSSECVREVFIAVDTDGDTISDFDEGNGFVDTDGDGTTDDLDTDSDNDGIPDIVEAGDDDMVTEPWDSDGDGRYDFRDLDSDSDGIPDEVETGADADGDGVGNHADVDSDGDYVPDADEGVVDTDSDGTPDYLDIDSDGDTILDEHELFADSDFDRVPNRIDSDSDNDGLTDAFEAGDTDLSTYPIDTDADGQPDYIDVDSDGDGLPDIQELGCAASSDRLDPDSDDDGYSDLAEVLVGAAPCTYTTADAFREYTDFFWVLPDGGPEQEDPLSFSSDIVQADVAISMDTTYSMIGEIGALQSTFSSQIFPDISAQIRNVAFGVSTFDDFLCNGHGSGADRPFILRQRVTTSVSAAQTEMNRISLHNGADINESGYESMYQVATGAGVSGCGVSIPAFNPASGRVPGVADGTIGGVGFRAGSFPVVVHVTDAPSHDGGVYGGFAATRGEAVNALKSIQARLVGVASGAPARAQLESVAVETGAVVPACAWDGARPPGCGAGQCCTRPDGLGRGTSGGVCPLVFDISETGAGLGDAIVTAIDALVNTTSFTVTTQLRRDEDEYRATGFDTRCFLKSVIPSRADSSGSCTTTPTISGESFRNVTPGTTLFFDVTAQNDGCVAEGRLPQAFTAYIDVIGDGLTVLDTQLVTIIVPAESANPSTVP